MTTQTPAETINTVAAIIEAHAAADLCALQSVQGDASVNQILRQAAHLAILDATGQDADALEQMQRRLAAAIG